MKRLEELTSQDLESLDVMHEMKEIHNFLFPEIIEVHSVANDENGR
jgi:hypothetical protein